MTTGHIVVMGRKTFESIGKPLPNRMNVVLTRSTFSIPGVQVISDLAQLGSSQFSSAGRDIFICGGAEVYRQALPSCSDLFLTLVKRVVEGDTFFPEFEHQFVLENEWWTTPSSSSFIIAAGTVEPVAKARTADILVRSNVPKQGKHLL
jgi:dihydrofolate reductase